LPWRLTAMSEKRWGVDTQKFGGPDVNETACCRRSRRRHLRAFRIERAGAGGADGTGCDRRGPERDHRGAQARRWIRPRGASFRWTPRLCRARRLRQTPRLWRSQILRRAPFCWPKILRWAKVPWRSPLWLATASRPELLPVRRAAVHRLPRLQQLRLWVRMAMAPVSDHRQPLLVSALGQLPLRILSHDKKKSALQQSARFQILRSDSREVLLLPEVLAEHELRRLAGAHAARHQ
jgi:hypothetical protein